MVTSLSMQGLLSDVLQMHHPVSSIHQWTSQCRLIATYAVVIEMRKLGLVAFGCKKAATLHQKFGGANQIKHLICCILMAYYCPSTFTVIHFCLIECHNLTNQ